MKKGLTEIVFILDRSGSMGGLEADTIGGFNAMMEKQKKETEAGEAYVSTILFDDKCEVLHDRIPIGEVPRLTEKEYYVRGCTALLDAIGKTVRRIRKLHKSAPEGEVPEKTIFIITTDGMENASKKYGYEKVKEMVKRRQAKQGWEFLFIGANLDAVKTAESVGISGKYAVDYMADEDGTRCLFTSMNKAVSAVRKASAGRCAQALEESDWDMELRADFEARN